MSMFEPKEYKGYRIVHIKEGYGMKRIICGDGSGKVPKALSGEYTTERFARLSIDNHLAAPKITNKAPKVMDKVKEVKDDKAESTPRSKQIK